VFFDKNQAFLGLDYAPGNYGRIRLDMARNHMAGILHIAVAEGAEMSVVQFA
jgi:hypothetical protein